MSTFTHPRREPATLGATGVLAVVLSASALVVPALGAPAPTGTIYACVKRHSGATRIVTASARCRHGEQKLSWNIAGPAGSRGARGPAGGKGADGKAGPDGLPGSNGAVSVYAARHDESLDVALLEAAPITVLLSKTVPPGSYSISAKTLLVGESVKAGFVLTSCAIVDTPGTAFSETHATLDISGWEAPLGERVKGEFKSVVTLPSSGTLTSTVTSTLSLVCVNFSGPEGAAVRALSTQLSAIQANTIV